MRTRCSRAYHLVGFLVGQLAKQPASTLNISQKSSNFSIWRSFFRDHSVSSRKKTALSCLEDMVSAGGLGRGRGSHHHAVLGFHLISLFPIQRLAPLPTMPAVPSLEPLWLIFLYEIVFFSSRGRRENQNEGFFFFLTRLIIMFIQFGATYMFSFEKNDNILLQTESMKKDEAVFHSKWPKDRLFPDSFLNCRYKVVVSSKERTISFMSSASPQPSRRLSLCKALMHYNTCSTRSLNWQH